jgi:hypothetical protein
MKGEGWRSEGRSERWQSEVETAGVKGGSEGWE